jgi:hypothetical protein
MNKVMPINFLEPSAVNAVSHAARSTSPVAKPQMDEMDAAIMAYLRLTPGASTSRIGKLK